MSATELQTLAANLKREWPTIFSAQNAADINRKKLRELLGKSGGKIRPDMSLIVFGSLARGEWTSRSDLDWSLLVDGQADPKDERIAKEVQKLLDDDGWTRPGALGAFGSLAFSHELIHKIGGKDDTHTNTTRRILLITESRAIDDSLVRERIIRCLLARYLEEDTHFHSTRDSQSFVPRFLLNDMIRYWRTIAVDYANKTLEPDRAGWALKNVKLRMSRKLVFVAGLLLCFRCHLQQPKTAEKNLFGIDESNIPFVEFLIGEIGKTPLDLLASFLLERPVADDVSARIIDSYEKFLETINDGDKREHLQSLTYPQAREDALFNEMREVGKEFQEGLRFLFFESDPEIRYLAQVYAIF